MRANVTLPIEVIRDRAVPPTAKKILAILIAHADLLRQCFPSQPTIAREADIDVRQVIRGLQQLLAAGWITRARRGRGFLYTIGERFMPALRRQQQENKTTRDSESREGRKDSESVSTTESLRRRPVEKIDEGESRAPLAARPGWRARIFAQHDPRRAMNGWLAKMGQFVGQTMLPADAQRYWQAALAAMESMTPDLRRYLNTIDAKMRASPWHREREAAVQRYWLAGRRA